MQRTQRSFIKNVKERKEHSVLFIKNAKELENIALFWKERKRMQERCVLLKSLHAQPWKLINFLPRYLLCTRTICIKVWIFFQIILVQFLIFFKSSYSSACCTMASAARNLTNAAPQHQSRPLPFLVLILSLQQLLGFHFFRKIECTISLILYYIHFIASSN